MIAAATERLNDPSSNWSSGVKLKHLVSCLNISECDLSVDDLWLDTSILHSIVLFLKRCDLRVKLPDALLVLMGLHWINSDLFSKYNDLFNHFRNLN